MAAEHTRHVRVQRALDQVNGISICTLSTWIHTSRPPVAKIYHDSLAQSRAKKAGAAMTFEERIEAILDKTREIATHLQSRRRGSILECDEEDEDDDNDDEFTIMDDDAHASGGFKRQLSRFLSLPRSLSKREMEEVTAMVLQEVNNTPDQSVLMHEIGSLIDENVLTPRDDDDDDDNDGSEPPRMSHRDSLSKRRQKELPRLEIHPMTDIDMAQRKIFKSANRLNGTSFRGGFDEIHKRGLASKGSMRSIFGSEMRLLARSPTACSPKGHAVSKAEQEELDAAAKEEAWRLQVKEDYIMWLRAKAEAQAAREKQRKEEQLARKKKKPRWLLLYEHGRLQQQHLEEQEHMQQSTLPPPSSPATTHH
ncbi:Aste57867_12163 [Aphanomyces stellatus]|uniref:Aste57867_12163 protein n=1 Tax=Aphanomyces stellatus TaxID=120398 RepID=A0A485KV98_9STRA|nr:hypothetical protein As57867_012118 [Aphanomyces stellatus]VFT89017.1 Aste57867_12163 [Aphanomyces stellatus]